MKISLNGIKNLKLSFDKDMPQAKEKDWIDAKISHCAICRTDAKIWYEGHRDIQFPRVPGHEMVVEYEGKRYVVWPGVACGDCQYCKSNNENLCDDIKIFGFHLDGGFSDSITIPKRNLIPIPDNLRSPAATFAEPAGCIVNAFKKINLKQDDSLLIYGAGTVGLLAALLAKSYGAIPTIIEKNEIKIQKADFFIKKTDVNIVKNTNESKFDCIINACSDPIAFISSIPKASKGARIVFFSGLDKNELIESNLLNLIHYKEISIAGSYGLTKDDMTKGLELISNNHKPVEMLIESIISPADIENIIPNIWSGKHYKYIIDFSEEMLEMTKFIAQTKINSESQVTNQPKRENKMTNKFRIEKPSEDIRANAQQKIDNKTKPLGALGILEDIAIKMSLIQNNLNPVLNRKALFVFAADHGIAEEGVSAFPQEVTQQMVQNFLNGGAAINVLSKHNEIDLSIIDIGVKGPINKNSSLKTRRVNSGTKNFALEPSMTMEEAEKSIEIGAEIFREENSENKINILGLGEMGIANTTSATAIISTITGVSPAECTGRGTGIDDQGLEHKIEVLEKALNFHDIDKTNGLDILSKVGGFEIGGMAGAALAAAESGCAVVLDGLISTAAGLIAYTINPEVANYFVAGHKSVEIGHKSALSHMNLTPVLDLNLRLGEGTGAALTTNLVDASCKIMRDMASFDEAGVSGKE